MTQHARDRSDIDGREAPEGPVGRPAPANGDTASPAAGPGISGGGEVHETVQPPTAGGQASVGESLRDLGRQTLRTGGVLTRAGALHVAEGIRAVRTAATERIQEGLEAMSVTPEEKQGLARKMVQVIPLVGGCSKYAQAWRMYHEGARYGDSDKQERARKECLVALADLGVDITLLSSLKVVKAAAKVGSAVQNLVGPALLARAARALGAKSVDPVDAVASEVIKSPRARKVSELLLNAIPPKQIEEVTPPEDIAEQVTAVVTEPDELPRNSQTPRSEGQEPTDTVH